MNSYKSYDYPHKVDAAEKRTTEQQQDLSKPTSFVLLGGYARKFLLVLSGINLVLGLVFYTYPSIVVPYWPWMVKELAVRFLGAIFLAIALGCWSAVEARVWQRAKILVLVGAAFFGLTGIISIGWGLSAPSSTLVWEWAGYFLAASAGCLIILKLHGWRQDSTEVSSKSEVPKGARIFFAIQTSVVGVFGAMMLLLPTLAQNQFWPWRVAMPSLETFGALFLATCLATSWAILQKEPARVIVLLPLDAVFPSLALIAVGISWSVIVAESPSLLVTGVWLGLYSFVAAGSTILYFTLRKGFSAQ